MGRLIGLGRHPPSCTHLDALDSHRDRDRKREGRASRLSTAILDKKLLFGNMELPDLPLQQPCRDLARSPSATPDVSACFVEADMLRTRLKLM